ncbi:alpha-L-arabinofuranosidase [Aureococcus anophagefferens]|nr:alpha-L-arabinofuranosidase [Aureococcus anophagefferens]
MVRHLYDAYAGPLYRVRRADDNATLDVGVGGVARQDEFCARSLCRVARIFDQSPASDLVAGIAGSSAAGGRTPASSRIARSQTVYAVLSGDYYNDACCFDYGNAYPDARDHGAGTMEAIYFGNKTKSVERGAAPPAARRLALRHALRAASLGGAVVLGTGGDNSNGGVGAFYEGAITAGFASDETDAAVQADVVPRYWWTMWRTSPVCAFVSS